MATQAKRSSYHHGNLRPALKAAALDLVHEAGVAGLNLREAAKRLGVSPAAPYRHFPDKNALLAALAQDGFEMLLPKLEQARDEAGEDGFAAFVGVGLAFVNFGTEHPAHFRLMYGADSPSRVDHPELANHDLEGFRILCEAISQAQTQGTFRSGNARQMALVSFSLVYGAVSAFIDGQMSRLGFSRSEAEEALAAGGAYLLNGFHAEG